MSAPALLVKALAALERGDPVPDSCKSAVAEALKSRLYDPIRFSFWRVDGGWMIGDGEREYLLHTHATGLYTIHWLLRHEGKEFEARELMQDAHAQTQALAPEDMAQTQLDPSWDCVIDPQTVAEIRVRDEAIKAQLDDLELDSERASVLIEERERLRDYIRQALGQGGKVRPFSNESENARKAIQRKIKRAIRKIRETAPSIGKHLDDSITTGHHVIYQQSGPDMVIWQLQK